MNKRKPTNPGVPPPPMAMNPSQSKAMNEMLDLVKGGFARESTVRENDLTGTAQPPAVPRGPEVPGEARVPTPIQVPPATPVPAFPREPRFPGADIQPPLGLDVALPRRIELPEARKKGMSNPGSGWTKVGWYLLESTKAAADVEVRRLQTTGSAFLDNAVRHYIAGLQTVGDDPEILLDEAVFLLKDILKGGVTEELRARAEQLIEKV